MVLEKQRQTCCTGTGSDNLWPWKHGWCPDFFFVSSLIFQSNVIFSISNHSCKNISFSTMIKLSGVLTRAALTEAGLKKILCSQRTGSRQFLLKHVGKLPMTSTEAKPENVPTVPLCSVRSPQQLYLNYRTGTNMLLFEAHLICIEADLWNLQYFGVKWEKMP